MCLHVALIFESIQVEFERALDGELLKGIE